MSHHEEMKRRGAQPAARVAVIGLGALGSAVAAALIEHRHSVRVWNPTR